MNNKRIGTAFEREMCELLASKGYWVHFIVPDNRGAQPFDIIAVRAGRAIAIDCKTCVADRITVERLEDNQIMAFERWVMCGNEMPIIAIKHKDNIFCVRYGILKRERSIKLSESNKGILFSIDDL